MHSIAADADAERSCHAPVFSYWQLQEQEKKKAYAAELQAQMQERQAQRQQERQQRFGGPVTGVCMRGLACKPACDGPHCFMGA